MKKYEIVKKTRELNWRDRKKIVKGCTSEDMYPEIIKSFDTLEEARAEFEKYYTSVYQIGNLFNVEEFYIEESEYDEDGEWERGDVWDITPMHIEVKEKPSYEIVATFDNYAEAESYTIKDGEERDLYI